ncbi:hypothetical protein C8Q75DRAFT_806073 [Abortiporus biennis]|nr:hypothetical protein C8Q75DRAFT_806073 [Abortiporus biennis]
MHAAIALLARLSGIESEAHAAASSPNQSHSPTASSSKKKIDPEPTAEFGGLSPELCDMILDYLHDDQAALKACSLTCKGWLPRSQYHLHYRVTMVDLPDGTLEGDLTDSDFPQIDPDFYSSPIVAAHVSELRLLNPPPPWEDDAISPTASLSMSGRQTIEHCRTVWETISRFTNIHKLFIANLRWCYHSPDEVKLLSRIFKNVSQLYLADSYFLDFSHFVHLLSIFPNLSHLTLSGMQWENPHIFHNLIRLRLSGRAQYPIEPSQPNLEGLCSLAIVGEGCGPTMMQDISHLIQSTNLRDTLSFTWNCPRNIGLLQLPNVLCALGSNLRKLDLQLTNHTEYLVNDMMLLNQNVKLQSLTLRISATMPEAADEYRKVAFNDALGQLLLQIHSDHLTHIHFICCLCIPSNESTTVSGSFTQTDLDNILSSHTFSYLSQVTFSFSYLFDRHKDTVSQAMMSCMPNLCSAGILKLEFGWRLFSYVSDII